MSCSRGVQRTSTVVVGFQQGEEGADGKDVGELGHNHLGGSKKIKDGTGRW
jgi:hypothetical protein